MRFIDRLTASLVVVLAIASLYLWWFDPVRSTREASADAAEAISPPRFLAFGPPRFLLDSETASVSVGESRMDVIKKVGWPHSRVRRYEEFESWYYDAQASVPGGAGLFEVVFSIDGERVVATDMLASVSSR